MIEYGRESIHIRVNAANPGQFLACCGLLELANRVARDGTEAWFEVGEFWLNSSTTFVELLEVLVEHEATALASLDCGLVADAAIAPLRLRLRCESIVLDAWTRIRVEKGRFKVVADSSWKFWSGQQSASKIWSSLRLALREQLHRDELASAADLFAQRPLLKGRFGFDAQAAWNALDAGYSPNDQNIPVASSPVIEMLALVGLQRFRPMMTDRSTFEYATWGFPLAVAAAQPAASGLVCVHPTTRFRGTIIRRGKYGGLAYANKLSGEAHEYAGI